MGMNRPMRYLVLIGDIVSSKRIQGRARFQEGLKKNLAVLSRDNESIASPYTLTLGDEFQAVYRCADGLFADLCRIRSVCLPSHVRLSLAVGGITTALNLDQALGMDGPAFHAARAGIDTLKNTGGDFALAGLPSGDDTLRAALIDLLCGNLHTWKANRWSILSGILAGKTIAELARENAITEIAVYKNIRHARLDALVVVLKNMEAVLNRQLTKKN